MSQELAVQTMKNGPLLDPNLHVPGQPDSARPKRQLGQAACKGLIGSGPGRGNGLRCPELGFRGRRRLGRHHLVLLSAAHGSNAALCCAQTCRVVLRPDKASPRCKGKAFKATAATAVCAGRRSGAATVRLLPECCSPIARAQCSHHSPLSCSCLARQLTAMVEPSQLFNRVLGRNTDTGGVEFWRQPERSGWLMKQGKRDPDGPGPAAFDCRRPNPFLIASIVGEFVKTWRRRCGTLCQERRAGVAA